MPEICFEYTTYIWRVGFAAEREGEQRESESGPLSLASVLPWPRPRYPFLVEEFTSNLLGSRCLCSGKTRGAYFQTIFQQTAL